MHDSKDAYVQRAQENGNEQSKGRVDDNIDSPRAITAASSKLSETYEWKMETE